MSKEKATEATKTETGILENHRSAARLAAVQALYEMDMVDADADQVLEEFLTNRWKTAGGTAGEGDDASEVEMAEPEPAWLDELVHGVVSESDELDGIIGQALSGDWTVERLETLIRVILRAGTYELKTKKKIPAAVIISEYLDVAHAFFEGSEPQLVNGVLDNLARTLRSDAP